MLILVALTREDEMYGHEIARQLQRVTGNALRVEDGSLYPALHRMEAKGWIESRWGVSQQNRKAKFYRLSETGRAQLLQQARDWTRTVEVVEMVLSAMEHRGDV